MCGLIRFVHLTSGCGARKGEKGCCKVDKTRQLLNTSHSRMLYCSADGFIAVPSLFIKYISLFKALRYGTDMLAGDCAAKSRKKPPLISKI